VLAQFTIIGFRRLEKEFEMNTGRQQGFTLMEVLVVVAIVGIIAAVALPKYQENVNTQKRVALQAFLIQVAQKLENYKVANNDYGAGNTAYGNALLNPAIYGKLTYPPTGATQYNLTISPAGGANAATSTAWEIDATPAGGAASNGVVKLNDQGWRCWAKSATPCTISATSAWD
jgi:type IV pilus assembly protein PilE